VKNQLKLQQSCQRKRSNSQTLLKSQKH